MKKFWRWLTNKHCAGDHFRLDKDRIVEIDGHTMQITGFSADASWQNDLVRVSVEFLRWHEPKNA